MEISILLLAYQEADNLKILLPKIINIMKDMKVEYEIIVVDSDTVLDKTPDICKEYGARYIPQEEKHYGGAFRTGIKYADGKRTVVLDSDGSHDPSVIPQLYQKSLEGYDIVIGSRYCKGGKTNDAITSRIMSKILNTIMRIIIDVKAKDISTSFRIYMTDQLKSVKLGCENYDILQEVILKIKLNTVGFKIGEVPILFAKRVYGESKRHLLKFICSYILTVFKLLNIRMKWSGNTLSET